MQRVHLTAHLGAVAVTDVAPDDVERLAVVVSKGRAPETVRNTVSFLHAVFEHAIAAGLVRENILWRVRRRHRPLTAMARRARRWPRVA